MKHIPFDTAHRWISRLAEMSYPIMIEQIPLLAAEFGWESTNRPGAYFYHDGSDAPYIRVSYDRKSNQVMFISFALVSDRTETLDAKVEVADCYQNYLAAASEAWGQASAWSSSPTAFTWQLGPRAYVNMGLRNTQVIMSFERVATWTAANVRRVTG